MPPHAWDFAQVASSQERKLMPDDTSPFLRNMLPKELVTWSEAVRLPMEYVLEAHSVLKMLVWIFCR